MMMELIEVRTEEVPEWFFPQQEFILVEGENIVCKLMAMEIAGSPRLDLSVITPAEFRRKGYATLGLKMLIEWAVKHGYREVTLTNLFRTEAIDRIAEELCFHKNEDNVWSKSITGPLNF